MDTLSFHNYDMLIKDINRLNIHKNISNRIYTNTDIHDEDVF